MPNPAAQIVSALCDYSGQGHKQPSDRLPGGMLAANTGWETETQRGAWPRASQRGPSENKPVELRRHTAPENSRGFLWIQQLGTKGHLREARCPSQHRCCSKPGPDAGQAGGARSAGAPRRHSGARQRPGDSARGRGTAGSPSHCRSGPGSAGPGSGTGREQA